MIFKLTTALTGIAFCSVPFAAYGETDEFSGCLNRTLNECKAVFAKHFNDKEFSIASSDLDEAARTWGTFDVSGKPILGLPGHLTLLGPLKPPYVILKGVGSLKHVTLPPERSRYRITLNLDQNAKVWNISFQLNSDPAAANTAEEYQKTNVFKLLSPFIPTDCPYRTEIELYKYFQDVVKPTIKVKRDTYVGVHSASDEMQYRSDRLPICGYYISYRRNDGEGFYSSSSASLGSYNNVEVIMWNEPAGF